MNKYVLSVFPKTTIKLYVNLIDSSAAGDYLNRRPYLIKTIKHLMSTGQIFQQDEPQEIQVGQNIGNSDIIETTEKDTIYYAKKYKKDYFVRLVKNRYPSPSSTLSLKLKKDEGGHYLVEDIWIGPLCPDFPNGKYETEESRQYWQNHALAQDSQLIQSSSITKVCPY